MSRSERRRVREHRHVVKVCASSYAFAVAARVARLAALGVRVVRAEGV